MELVRFQNVARQLKMFITRHNTFFNSDFAVFSDFRCHNYSALFKKRTQAK